MSVFLSIPITCLSYFTNRNTFLMRRVEADWRFCIDKTVQLQRPESVALGEWEWPNYLTAATLFLPNQRIL